MINTQRSPSRSLRDGDRWVFINEGAPYPFEDVAKYSEGRYRERVSPGDIEAFCVHFGAPVSEEGFTGPALIIANNSSAIRRSFSYQDAQREMDIAFCT